MPRKLWIAALLCLFVVGLSACDDDEVTDIVEYDLTIVNNDDVEYELWIDASVDTEEFVQDGVIGPNSTRVLRDRTISVLYHMRLCTPDQNPNLPDEEWVYEERITSNGPNITWTVPEVTP